MNHSKANEKICQCLRESGGNDKHKARKVPVLVAQDRDHHTVDGILQNESAKELCCHLNGRISIEATVCADAHLAHEKLAEILGFEFKELVTSKGQHVLEGIYHIQHVNAYHSHLKRWISGVLHGVATKYLSHYLGWRRQLTESIKLSVGRLINKISVTLVSPTTNSNIAQLLSDLLLGESGYKPVKAPKAGAIKSAP